MNQFIILRIYYVSIDRYADCISNYLKWYLLKLFSITDTSFHSWLSNSTEISLNAKGTIKIHAKLSFAKKGKQTTLITSWTQFDL